MLNSRDDALLRQLDAIIAQVEMPAIKRELMTAAHKLRYPMASILAKVPGDTLSDRARRIGVSRQTMYVWAHERFRPIPGQAKIISNLTDVPIAHITDDGFEVEHDTGGEAGKKAARVAARPEKPAKRAVRAGGAKRERRGVVDDTGRRRPARKLRKRTGG